MESLLTAVEFVIEDSTMTNLTAEDSTTDVTENNPTATSTFTTEYSTINSNVDDHFFSNNLDVPDDPIEVPSLESIYVPLPSMHTEEPGDEQDNNTHFDHSAILNHQSQANARTKKTNSVSQVEFRHVNASRKRLSELTYSIRGANLRKKRRNNDGMAVACNLQVEAMIDIDITPTSSKEDIKEFFGLNSNDKLTELLRDIRLREINFYLSENETPKLAIGSPPS